jgi:hypothetical protein
MFFKHHALNRLSLVVAIASLFGAAAGGPLVSTKRDQLPDTGIGLVSSHIVNRALKADKLVVPQPHAVEPETTQAPRPDGRGSDIKIGCERPFSAMVSTRSDIPGRCIASTRRLHPTPA